MSNAINNAMPGYQPTYTNINNARLKGKEDENPLDLKKAIKVYQNKALSGGKEKLTDAEKADIKMLINYIMDGMDFIERYKANELTQEDFDQLNESIESLFESPAYRTKVNFFEFVIGYLEPLLEDAIDADNPPDLKFKVVIPDVNYEMMDIDKPMSISKPFMAISPHQLQLNGTFEP